MSKKNLIGGLGYFFANLKSPLPFNCRDCDKKIEWNCRNQVHDLKESVFEKATEDNRQEINGKKDNRGKTITKVFNKLGGLYFYECPLGWITAETNIIINLLTAEENPVKIFPGTWIEQPHWYIEAKQLYNQAKNKWLQQPKV